jgi:hypothetical protein
VISTSLVLASEDPAKITSNQLMRRGHEAYFLSNNWHKSMPLLYHGSQLMREQNHPIWKPKYLTMLFFF